MALQVASFALTGGLNVDQMAHAVPPDTWTSASNIDFRGGHAGRSSGMTAYGGNVSVGAPRHLLAAVKGEQYNLVASPSKLFHGCDPYAGAPLQIGECITSTAAHRNVTPVAWVGAPGIAGQWTSGFVNRIPFMNHPGYAPVQGLAVMAGGAAFINQLDWVAVFGAGVTCTAMRSFNNHLFALGQITFAAGPFIDGDYLAWSNVFTGAAWPATPWNVVAGSQAGNAVLTGGGELVDAATLGPVMMIYKRRSIWAARYVGGNYVFDFQKVCDGIGALSQNCIADIGGRHIFLSDDDLMVWNGSGKPESVLGAKSRRLIRGVIDESNWASSFVLYRPREREVWACFPGGAASFPTTLIVLDLATGHTGTRTVSGLAHGTQYREATAVGPGILGNSIFAYYNNGGGNPSRFFLDDPAVNTVLPGTTAFIDNIVKAGVDFGAPDRVKLVKWVRPWATSNDAAVIQCDLQANMTPTGTSAYVTAVNFTIGTSDKADLFGKGRFFTFRFRSTLQDYRIGGFDVGYEYGGQE